MQVHFNVEEVLNQGVSLAGFPCLAAEGAKRKEFLMLYGCIPEHVAFLWDKLDVIKLGAEIKHLFWTLYNLKPTGHRSLCTLPSHNGQDLEGTIFRKWIATFAEAMHVLDKAEEDTVVRYLCGAFFSKCAFVSSFTVEPSSMALTATSCQVLSTSTLTTTSF